MNLRAHLCALAIALAASLAPVANLAHAGVLENFAENKIPLIMFVAGLVLCLVFRPDMAALSGGVTI